MKNVFKILFLLPFLSVLLVTSCEKDGLPKATQTGANTMAAKVNGKAWQQKACWSCTGGGTGLVVNYDDRDFFAVLGEDNDLSTQISIGITSLKKLGTYNLGDRALDYAELYNNKEKKSYYTSIKNTGQITITKLDLVNKIISGIFEFTAEDENNPANTIKVTDGRFDVKYY